jgi:methylmalonyl-CoA/ethylmalonyl-CoA epimerase
MVTQDRFVLPAPNQIGFAVRDVDASLTRYRERYGLAASLTETIELNERCAYRYHGRASACRLKIALFDHGTVQLEFIQLLEGEHPVGDFLRQRGEGINHLGFFVDDLDATVRALVAQGARPIIEGRFQLVDGRAGAFIWLNDDEDGGTMVEISSFK